MARKPKAEPIEFEAIIPMLKSAMNIAGDGGAQIKLEISEQHIEAVKQLMDMRGQVLRVTIEVE